MTNRDRLLLTAPVVGLILLGVVPPTDGRSLCPIALITGIACPGCGMTRAVSHLIQGDMAGALTYHPLVIPVLVLAGAAWGWFLLWRLGRAGPVPRRWLNTAILASAVALVAVWVVRLSSGTLPPV
jgi:hypothetical protein